MKILIGADIVPTQSNIDLFNAGNADLLIGCELKEILRNVDLTVFNLEVPLTDCCSPIDKNGPALIAPASSIAGLAQINPGFFTLANNHILDQGYAGLHSTIDLLRKNKIAFAGAGENISEASRTFVKEMDGVRVGIYCCAEHEFSIATDETPGANPFDPLESPDHILELKKDCDWVIVLYHGGKEEYRFPTPYLQKVCRKMVDKGADLVICQHSHCIGCEEKWNNGTIVYGQGNFLFDLKDNDFWRNGLLVDIDLTKTDIKISYIPICKQGRTVRKADEATAKKIMKDFFYRSGQIQNNNFICKQYEKFTRENMWIYYKAFAGGFLNNPLYRLVNKILKYRLNKTVPARKYSPTDKIVLQNYIECEAHRELLLNGLKLSEKD